MTDADDRLLTVKELCGVLRCSQSTIYRLIYQGKLPFLKIGADYRFSPKLIRRWIEASETYYRARPRGKK